LAQNVRTILVTHYSFEGEPRYYESATINEFLPIVPSDLPVVRQGSIIQVSAPMPQQLLILAPAANGQ
jgi:hypothetical protein